MDAIQAIPARLVRYLGPLSSLGNGSGKSSSGKRSSIIDAARCERAGAALRTLQRGLTGDRRLAGNPYFSQADFLDAYLLYYWPVSYMQVSLALAEIAVRYPGFRPRRVLDIGAGPGPASFVAADFGAADTGAAGAVAADDDAMSVTLIDASDKALQRARELHAMIARSSGAVSFSMSTAVADLEDSPNLPEGPFDLIVACHSANELWKEKPDAPERRMQLFAGLSGLLAEGGLLLVVEPAATVTSRPALALRDALLAASGEADVHLECVAPCPGSMPCPILGAGEQRSCHSTWPWNPPPLISDLAKAAGLERDAAKATWFALRNSKAAAHTLPCAPGLPAALDGRIISEPMLNKAGRLRYILCMRKGLATLSAGAADPHARLAGFPGLARGDLVTIHDPEIREGTANFGFGRNSSLDLRYRSPDAGRKQDGR
jgi:SAM-dependent methyltransferase